MHVHIVNLDKSYFLPFLLERFDKLLFFTDLSQKTGHAFTKAVTSHLWEQYKNKEIHRVVLLYHFLAFFHLPLFYSVRIVLPICSDCHLFWPDESTRTRPSRSLTRIRPVA